jgi:hypothetical protein
VSDDASTKALVDRWAREYSQRTGRVLYEIEDHGYTYVYDVEGSRVVCVSGRSQKPTASRDITRQRGSPPPGPGDHRGHIIAHSIGGGMDINLIKQNARLNTSSAWREIERHAAEHPSTAVAIHLQYRGDSDRPFAIEYAHEDPDRGLVVDRFANPLDRPRTADGAMSGPQAPSPRREPDARDTMRDHDSRERS